MKKNIVKIIAFGLLLASSGGAVCGAEKSAEKTTQPPAQTQALDLARQLNDAFINVADRLSPAVVVIEVWHKPDFKNEETHPLLEFLPPEWRRQFERERQQQQPQQQPRRQRRNNAEGSGSGVIIREDGFIMTNNHVVDGAERIRVRLSDRREFEAEIKGVDPLSDIAVIKIPAKGLVVARLGDSSKVRVGEFAIAIGAPFELDHSVTIGHVSAKGRSRIIPSSGMDQDFIQTDANINPGNSGGPLVNLNGEVIGINTLIRGLGTGIGFAIPINLAKTVSESLISNGRYVRAWLGIGITALPDFLGENPDFRDYVKDVKQGVVVSQIVNDGPAAKSGLEASDVITSVDGRAVANANELRSEVRSKKIGETVTLDVVRNNKQMKIKVPTAAWPESEQGNRPVRSAGRETPQTESDLGMTVETLTQKLAEQYDVDETAGVVVTAVEQGSVAAERRIAVGDVITKVNQQPVRNAREFRDAIKKADPKKGVIVNLISKGQRKFEILKAD